MARSRSRRASASSRARTCPTVSGWLRLPASVAPSDPQPGVGQDPVRVDPGRFREPGAVPGTVRPVRPRLRTPGLLTGADERPAGVGTEGYHAGVPVEPSGQADPLPVLAGDGVPLDGPPLDPPHEFAQPVRTLRAGPGHEDDVRRATPGVPHCGEFGVDGRVVGPRPGAGDEQSLHGLPRIGRDERDKVSGVTLCPCAACRLSDGLGPCAEVEYSPLEAGA